MSRQYLLDTAQAEASNLMEGLSINFTTLVATLSPQAKIPVWDKGITRKMRQAADAIHAAEGIRSAASLAKIPSDTARGIAAFIAMMPPAEALPQRLKRIRPYADDSHFGVREWAWMAIRPYLAEDLPQAIALLTPWTADRSTYIRRFAVEALRPRGVWCLHIDALKVDPSPALPLLTPLRNDPEKYVQDSVSNWLNDAAKTRPEWVNEVCDTWLRESPTPITQRIARRARRSIQA